MALIFEQTDVIDYGCESLTDDEGICSGDESSGRDSPCSDSSAFTSDDDSAYSGSPKEDGFLHKRDQLQKEPSETQHAEETPEVTTGRDSPCSDSSAFTSDDDSAYSGSPKEDGFLSQLNQLQKEPSEAQHVEETAEVSSGRISPSTSDDDPAYSTSPKEDEFVRQLDQLEKELFELVNPSLCFKTPELLKDPITGPPLNPGAPFTKKFVEELVHPWYYPKTVHGGRAVYPSICHRRKTPMTNRPFYDPVAAPLAVPRSIPEPILAPKHETEKHPLLTGPPPGFTFGENLQQFPFLK